MLIAGDEDTEHGTVSVRYRDGRQDNGLSVERVTELVQDAVRQRAQV
jgi:threonyl-tRNA synthetase